MKQAFLIILGLVAMTTCSFLRNLAPTTINAVSPTCFTSVGDITVTLDAAPTATDVISFTLTSSSGQAENNFAYSGTATSSSTTLTCSTTETTKTPYVGDYTITSLKLNNTAITDPANTIKTTYAKDLLSSDQTTPQTVDPDSDDKKTFFINFSTFTAGTTPKIYASTTATTALTCEANADLNKLTCTPKSTEMEDGKTYNIAYDNACGVKTETGVTVKYGSSSFLKYSFFLLGLFLL